MPKIIENLENRLIEEAKKQIQELGYGAVTIRSVANACGVGVGTVYNYFPSKDDLLAAYMLQDWKTAMDEVQEIHVDTDSPVTVCQCIYERICAFSEKYDAVFQDPVAKAGLSPSYTRYHRILRSQLAAPLRKYCDSDFATDFVSEALLHWTLAGKSFDEIYGMIGKHF